MPSTINTVAIDIVTAEAGLSIFCNIANFSAPSSLSRNGKLAITNVIEPNIVNGNANINASLNIFNIVLLFNFSPITIIGSSILSNKLIDSPPLCIYLLVK